MQRRDLLVRTVALAAYGAAPRTFARPRPLKIGVVGGGIVGASIAMHLAQAGARVTLFEKVGPARGATENSFAWVNVFTPDANYRALRLQSLLAYRDLDATLKLNMTWGGYLDWASDASGAQAVRSNADQLAGTPYPARTLELEDLLALEPALLPGPVTAAFFSSIDGHLDPVKVTRAFLERAKSLGSTVVYPCEVQGLEFRGARLKSAVTSCGTYPLDRLVVAAGVETPRILAMAGFTLSLRHAPGILAHSAPLRPLTPRICDAPGGLSFKQMRDGSVVGTDAQEPPDTPVHHPIRIQAGPFPDDALRAYHGNRILTKVESFLPGARGMALDRLTLGFRPMPLDEYPVMGVLPSAADVHVAVTHSGVTLAPILGRYTRDEVLEGSRVGILAPYRPERFTAPAARDEPAAQGERFARVEPAARG